MSLFISMSVSFHPSFFLSFIFPWLGTRLKSHLAIHPSLLSHYFTLVPTPTTHFCLPHHMAQSQVIYLSSHPSVFLSTSSTLLSYFQCKGKEEKGAVYPTVKRCMSGDFKDVTSLASRHEFNKHWRQCIWMYLHWSAEYNHYTIDINHRNWNKQGKPVNCCTTGSGFD